jgi:transposase-like protein
VRLVISDAHTGLKAAISKTLAGASWQRCRVHLMRNLLARIPRSHAEMVAATIRTIFAQPDSASTTRQLRMVTDALREQHPAAADLLDEAEPDVTAYATFPRAHWRKIWSGTIPQGAISISRTTPDQGNLSTMLQVTAVTE